MRSHPVTSGKRERQSYSRINEIAEMPNLIELQTESFRWFMEEGIQEVFEDASPIVGLDGKLLLEFKDYHFEIPPDIDLATLKENDLTYMAKLWVKVRLGFAETEGASGEIGEIGIRKEQEVYLGDFPIMTPQGTFIYNGAERAVVTQLVRSPGAYYSKTVDKSGKDLFSTQVIPNRGAWLEFETDSNEIISIRVDRARKQPLTVFIKAMHMFLEEENARFGAHEGLSLNTNADLIRFFGAEDRLIKTMEKDTTEDAVSAIKEIYKKQRPGEPPNEESALSLLRSMFFDFRRYDISKVGRYKYNKKLGVANRLENQVVACDIVDPESGEIFVEKGQKVDKKTAFDIENAGISSVEVFIDEQQEEKTKIIGNNFVDPKNFVDFDIEDLKLSEKVYYPVLRDILNQAQDDEEIKELMKKRKKDLSPKHIVIDDMLASVSYILNLEHGIGSIDDIDHLGNRRLRTVGELLQNQFRIGLAKMEKNVREKMSTQDVLGTGVMPQSFINIKPVTSAMKEFFGSSQLSQFMDQNNPLAELTHKRRLSALGPGGLSRERAGFEVRDVHYSHYGRMCPIETPEGPNIGLIGSLTTYGIINKYGFIETPYRVVKDGVVTKEIRYLSADDEEEMIVAQANEPLTDDFHFVNKKVAARGVMGEVDLVPRDKVDYMDVSPKQVVSVATAMIPFLENDDANRALMGANMQRQAVPLLVAEAPIIGTGIEHRAAKDSGAVVISKNAGTVCYVDANRIEVETEDGNIDKYNLLKFKRSNQGTCMHQKPIVFNGEKIEKGEIIADGPSTELGEIALGKNLLIGFMTWEGYNYEDAIILNERLIMEDVLTSLHIEEYETEARKVKKIKRDANEEITRDIPGIRPDDESLRNLDENGIIRIGAEVSSNDILVGKITPKGETDQTPEEKIIYAIFGKKAKDVRDNSLRMPHGEAGIVVDIHEAKKGDELCEGENEHTKSKLPEGVLHSVRVTVATKRKISVGDKMAGRHGNKGVISKILPEEDMPFLENGEPLQVMLNPLGVPSRMNVGQVLEVHLGLAAKEKGFHVATPVFDGASEIDVIEELRECGYDESGKLRLRDGRTGEYFDNPVTVGYMYMLKLHHLVDDKIHARSTGPYSLVTRQPLGGKAQFGGQRFGEMEVWALEAYGAAYTLQEILTVKSDDIKGRVDTYKAISKGENLPKPGLPESFKVLVREMQSLCLDVKGLTADGQEVSMETKER